VTSEAIPNGGKLFGIQMLRGLAAVSVVLHHTLEESRGAAVGLRSPDWLTTAGAAGVDVFFVISGFVMLHGSFPIGRGAIDAGRFLFRRAARIYPLYWLCCLAVIAICAVGFLTSKVISADVILKSLLLIVTPDTLVGVSWTLSYEIYFYLIFALTLPLRSREASVAICAAVIIGVTAAARFLPAGYASDFFADPIAVEFCLGLVLALGFARCGDRMSFAPYWSLLGVAAIAVAPLFVFHPDTGGLPGFLRVIVWGLPACLIVSSFLVIRPAKSVGARFGFLLGEASYALYLTHSFVMIAYAKLLNSTVLGEYTQIAVIPFVIAVCIAVGLTTHLVVERRLLAWTRSLEWRRPTSGAVLPAGSDGRRSALSVLLRQLWGYIVSKCRGD
jgi:peptidoglycan/LPS O-acetylase OafA/YrhL